MTNYVKLDIFCHPHSMKKVVIQNKVLFWTTLVCIGLRHHVFSTSKFSNGDVCVDESLVITMAEIFVSIPPQFYNRSIFFYILE